TAVVWFRRDLRVRDLPALAHACREHERVVALFVFDPALLGGRFRSHARTAHVSDDVTGFARARDARVEQALGRDAVKLIRHPGLYVADLPAIRTATGGPYTVYSPFLRAWKAQERRPVEAAPQEIAMPRIAAGRLPSLRTLGFDGSPPPLVDFPAPGEDAARRAARAWVEGQGLARYAQRRNELAEPTSRLSAYLRFGCLSPLKLERAVAAR